MLFMAMNHPGRAKVLLIIAIWFCTGGLSFADNFDLTDDLRNSPPDLPQALEPDLDEVRETGEPELASPDHLSPPLFDPAAQGNRLQPFSGISLHEAARPLHEILRTFRI